MCVIKDRNWYKKFRFTDRKMSKATKRKHVVKEVDDLSVPTESQSIVRVLEGRGNNLHEVEDVDGKQYLVSMPVKFRRNIWVKRGDFVLVEPIPEGDKVKAEIVRILRRDHIKWYRAQNCWPKEFDDSQLAGNKLKDDKSKESESEDDLFVNTNRQPQIADGTDSESETNSDSSDSS